MSDLLDRLRPALSPDALRLLEPLIRLATLSSEDGDEVATFDRDPRDEGDDDLPARQLRILAPGPPAPDRSPDPVRALLGVCGGLVLGTPGETGQRVLHDGFSGTLAVVGADAWSERRTGLVWSPELCAPIDLDLQGYYVVHPRTGELWLCDEGFERVVGTRDPVEVWLLEVHACLRTWREPATPLQRAVASTPDPRTIRVLS